MKNVLNTIRFPAVTGALFACAIGWGTTASAQFSGGILSLDQLDEASFRLTTEPIDEEVKKVRLSSDFRFGSKNVHRFIREFIDGTLPSFDGGDGPDYVQPNHFDGGDGPDYVKPNNFDGGDGPDYVKPNEFDGGDGPDYVKPNEFDGGDGPDYVKPNEFDGGDGPDYVMPETFLGGNALVGSDAADSLVGSDAADSLVGSDAADSLVGSDAADSLVGSDAADSLVGSDAADSLWFQIEVEAESSLIPLIAQLAAEMHNILDSSFDQIPVVLSHEQADVLSNKLVATGNEVAIFDAYKVSLKATGNEVAISSAHSAPSFGALSGDLEVLLLDLELGIMTTEQFGAEISTLIGEWFLLNGIETQSVKFSIN